MQTTSLLILTGKGKFNLQMHFRWTPAGIFICALVVILFITGWYETLQWMVIRFSGADSYYSHGFIIPIISGYLIWQKKEFLKQCEIRPSVWGIVLIVFALLLHVIGTVFYVFSISGFSIFFLIIGLVLFLFGFQVFKTILFPLMFLLFMFPLPISVINSAAFPMKLMVAKAGAQLVGALGIPVFQEGFNISIPAGSLLVGNPCSGLRSLLAFLMVGTLFSYLSDLGFIKRIVLVAFTIPIALTVNILRVCALILISNFWGLKAAAPESFWHTASGVMLFVVALGFFFTCVRVLQWIESK